ncbi:MAG TPA: DegT/DnrJ/EryC1/StrS family aminotransferase [Cyclobacteriaceae bacterium]|nr:DegT/DnrJ/EryC1/StrS family aminotransferase [Cyclobacteriaceae bacterium]
MTMISIHSTYIHPKASEIVAETLKSTFLSEGKVVRMFEESLTRELGFRNCVTVNSGTTALHLALVLAGISEGDEIILPPQTFVATGLVIVQQGATPVFADIDYTTGNISAESIRQKITQKTKAIIPVHWAGYPCDMEAIASIAKEYNLLVIEDAAHALGASYKDEPVGNLSDFTCFSFQAIKHLTTGDGGALVCRDADKLQEATERRWFGINRRDSPQTILGERSYNIRQLGYKYHLNDFAASLGMANLSGLHDRLKKRRAVADFYTLNLDKIPGIHLFNYKSDRKSAYWLFGFHVEKRMDFIKAMMARGIEASVVHQRIDRNSILGGIQPDLIHQTQFDETQINIPIHDGVNLEAAEMIVGAIAKGW